MDTLELPVDEEHPVSLEYPEMLGVKEVEMTKENATNPFKVWPNGSGIQENIEKGTVSMKAPSLHRKPSEVNQLTLGAYARKKPHIQTMSSAQGATNSVPFRRLGGG